MSIWAVLEQVLWVLWPPPAGYIGPDGTNENSLVLKLVYGNFSVLLTGDAGRAGEADLLADNHTDPSDPSDLSETSETLQSTVLKVGHHGSQTSTSPAFVHAVRPWLAVIQVGVNSYGHPHPQVLETLDATPVLRNDLHGRIHIWSDGTQMWLTPHDVRAP
ncbi:MAG: hypothetical protein WDZ49_00600 [Litorilinea sp.]